MQRNLSVWFVGTLLVCLPCTPPVCGCDPQPEVVAATGTTGAEWSEEHRRADPAGYFAFVRQRFDQEAETLKPAYERLKHDVERQTEAIQAQLALWLKAKEVAQTFRTEYQRAEDTGQWPVEVCGAFYCQEQLLSQVSMLMEEAKALAECVATLKAARERAEAKLEELNVRMARVDAQRSVCTTLFELWNASQIRSDGEQMLACLEQLIADQPLQLASCTARTADGFPAIPAGLPKPHRNMKPIVRYLQHLGGNDHPTRPVQVQQTRTSTGPPKSKPIFTQH